jgi:CubicO group peptidase (beta-lactamase class C family)
MSYDDPRAPSHLGWPLVLATLWGALLVSGGPILAQDGGSEGWRTATPASAGLDPERLSQGLERIRELDGTRSVLVVSDGRIVAERSFAGSGLNRQPWNFKSASKSILSALVGIAVERGWISGLDATVGELLPGYAEGLPEAKRRIRLRDLLTMRAGLASTSSENYGAWVATDDWTEAALARPLVDEPGETFRYSTGTTHLVSAILTEATGRSTLELARETLLAPLDVEIHSWQRSPEGYYFGGNNAALTPRDVARFGLLYLQDGRWQGEQVVPAEWVETSTGRHAEGWPDHYGSYGYFWWQPPGDPWSSFAAIGYGMQLLYAVPELSMLVVVTSSHASKGAEWDGRLFEILRRDVFGVAE